MRIVLSLVVSFLFSVGYSQIKFDPDARIIENHGEQKAKELIDYRPNYYNYLVYQLNHTCTIVDKKEAKKSLNSKQKFKNENGEELTKDIVSSSDFNYMSWGIVPDKELTTYYLLADGSYLKVLSERALTNKFRVSPKNTKNLY